MQNTISVLPRSVELNGVLQRYGTGSIVMTPERVVSKLARVGGRHLDHHRRFGSRPLEETTVVEIGTGFAPSLPVGLYLAGAAAVHTFDIARLDERRAGRPTCSRRWSPPPMPGRSSGNAHGCCRHGSFTCASWRRTRPSTSTRCSPP